MQNIVSKSTVEQRRMYIFEQGFYVVNLFPPTQGKTTKNRKGTGMWDCLPGCSVLILVGQNRAFVSQLQSPSLHRYPSTRWEGWGILPLPAITCNYTRLQRININWLLLAASTRLRAKAFLFSTDPIKTFLSGLESKFDWQIINFQLRSNSIFLLCL